MKTIIRKMLLLLLPCMISCKGTPIEEIELIPQPQSIEYQSGITHLKKTIKIGYDPQLQNEAELLQAYLEESFQLKSNLAAGSRKGNIILQLDDQYQSPTEGGYTLTAARNITILSNSSEGIFNGIQTLRQIIRPNESGYKVQRATITDYPAFTWRAYMLDEGRNFQGKEVVKNLLDEMAILKMNQFHWHLTDDQGWRIEIKKYPDLTKIGASRDSTQLNGFNSSTYDQNPAYGFYTQEDIKEIVAYAAKRHINIVPEIEMPGHSSAAIAAYSWLGVNNQQIKVPCNYGVKYDVYNIADPKVIQFLEDVLSEVITLFPSPVIHIGGDEVRHDHWQNSPQVQAYMKQHHLQSPAELQVFFTRNISAWLAERGKKMAGWNEITGEQIHDYQNNPEEIKQKLAEGTIVQYWQGEVNRIKKTIEQGYDVINAFHSNTYLDYSYELIPLEKAYAFNPIPENLPKELHCHVIGSGCQMWGEFTPTAERVYYQTFPRIAAFAEVGWTENAQKDYARFSKSLQPLLKRWEGKGYQYGPTEKKE